MSGKKYHFWFVPLVAIIEIAIVSQIGLLFMQYLFPNVNLSSSISMTVSTTVGATIVIFDLAMLLIFYQFLNDTKVEFQTYDDRLSCISKYGFICNFLSILALGVYVTRAVIGRTAYNANVLLSFVYVIFNLIFCALLKMKYDLLVLDAAASNANESTIKGVDKL
ncbi:hypothetical protein BCR33DRAFT_782327 [Rhizoclosmatium globosum]|uniref:Uncharacterized protein n=1 Tax=Rhizoclosmatium globosum TaxID=329046 RepID=A0A1Y2CNV2_9FUNG|nr:hypothetical protein BCR33DRAFT_782327 [Rhizoclosmatium globosum]|eukprot:ORY48626.1 hypothetical protein BCR33DRAFT_782327 [Rhizoclosmatium globosum]